MTISYNMPDLLKKLSVGLKYGGTALAVLALILAGWLQGLISLVVFWVLAILCDAVVELYRAMDEQILEKP